MSEKYSIINLEGYADALRKGAAESFTKDYQENLDDFISIKQIISLIEKNSLGRDQDNNYIINEDIFNDVFDQIRDWIYEVGLAKLAANGFVECAWDSDNNCMVFWLADKDKTSISNKPSEL